MTVDADGNLRRAVATADAPEKTAAFSAAVQPGLDVQADTTESPKPSNIEELHDSAGVRTRMQTGYWARQDSNLGPRHYQ